MAQSKIASTSTKLHFQFVPNEPETESGTYYIDIAQCLSMTQRRSYRQGMNFAVKDMKFIYTPVGPPTPALTTIDVSTIPTTWIADNATTKAYESWLEQRSTVLEEQPSLKAKWADFKIFMDSQHAVAGVAANLIPANSLLSACTSQQLYSTGEWDMSQFVVPLPGADQIVSGTAQEVVFHVTGDHFPPGDFDTHTTSVGLIKAYAASRALVLSPDPVPEGQYIAGFYNTMQSEDEKSQDIMDNVANRNDSPPYSVIEYPGSDTNAPTAQLVSRLYPSNYGSTTSSLVASVSTLGSFIAPFGLIKIETCGLSTGYDYINVELELVPGNYKGILAEKGV